MLDLEKAETTALRQCHSCAAEQLDRDKFCRRCGASQSRALAQSGSQDILNVGGADCETGPLPVSGGTLRRSYSGPLVGMVAQKLSEEGSSLNASRWVRLLISMIVAVPLWLMIILLSPLDAYVAAKDLAKQV